MNGTLERVAFERRGRVMRFERLLNHPVKQVWAALTSPEKLADWLARTDTKFNSKRAAGSPLKLTFDNTKTVINGTVTKVKTNKLLEYTWDDQQLPAKIPTAALKAGGNGSCVQDLRTSRIRWELSPKAGGSTLLTLTHTLPAPGRSRGGRNGGHKAKPIKPAFVLASWQNHLDGLSDALGRGFRGRRRGKGGPFPWNNWEDLRAKYEQAIGSM